MRWLLPFLIAASMHAAPVIRNITPHGAQRGTSITLHIKGTGFNSGAKLQTTLPAAISRLVAAAGAENELPFLITLNADAPVGLYPIRILSNDGMSNLVLFSVGDLPEVDKKVKALTIPVLVNGTLTEAGQDDYHFTVKAGQKLVCEVEARRAGSALDPVLEIFDAAGRMLVRNDDGAGVDPRIEHTFAKAGQYKIRVHDARYSDQAANFYRLKIGTYAFAEGLYPLGWKRGEPVEVEIAGGNLSTPVKVRPATNSKAATIAVGLPHSPSLPLQFALSDKEEMLESERLRPGAIMNGRIAKPGEIDKYKLAVKPGEPWVFELTAAALGSSQLDGLITLFDEKGKKLASRDDTASADPAFPFVVPEGVKELTVAVEDLLGRGGPAYAYRLEARREPADFTATINAPFLNIPAGGTVQLPVTVQRRGYDGPLKLKVLNLPKGFKTAGGNIPAEAAAQNFNETNAGFRAARGVLTITAEAGAAANYTELIVTAETPGGAMRRVAQGVGTIVAVRGTNQRAFTAPWLNLALPVAVTKPLPVSIAAATPFVRFMQGFEYPVEYRVKGRVTGKVRSQIAGAVGNLRILDAGKSKSADTGAIILNTNFGTPVTTFDMILEATADIDGVPTQVSSAAIEIEIVPGYQIHLEPSDKMTFRGSVLREPTFLGSLIRLQVQDLPDHVNCPAVEVPEPEKRFTIACKAETEAAAGVYDVRITSAAPDTGQRTKEEYKIGDINAKLVVAAR